MTCIERHDLIGFLTNQKGRSSYACREDFTRFIINSIHKTRIKTLLVLLEGLIESKELKLTALGRALSTSGQERAGILRVNRFLGNSYYQTKSINIYRAISKYVIGDKLNPDIVVDWSSLPNSYYTTMDGEHCVLKTCYSSSGRSITIISNL
ncbi:MAG TPA: hypothetical protein VHD33_05020 [Legionellaceae bacterium]|nr:hypothetical protein [Legionellaceae bacterium]